MRALFPDQLQTKLKYNMTVNYAGDGVATDIATQFQLNKMNDPAYAQSWVQDHTIQPYEYDMLAAAYDAYTVNASKIVAKLFIYDTAGQDKDLFVLAITPRDSNLQTLADVGAQDLWNQSKTIPNARSKIFMPVVATNLGSGQIRPIVVKNYARVAKLHGHRSPLDNNVVYITGGNDPVDYYTWYLAIANVNNSTLPTTFKIRGEVTITYYATWFFRKTQPTSKTSTTTIPTGGNQANTAPA
jgi:hypothetical protein